MALALAAATHERITTGDNADLAATLLRIDGHRLLWRACGLKHDPDVTAWAADALDVLHPDYASLFWWELVAIRASHN